MRESSLHSQHRTKLYELFHMPDDAGTCEFCDEFAGSASRFSLEYPDFPSRVILKWRDFRVVPSIGQIAEGHLLILPTPHVTAIGSLSGRGLEDLEQLVSAVRSTLSETYRRTPIFFEHGTVCGDSGGCGIDHMHLHCVPVTVRVARGVAADFPLLPIASLSDLQGFVRAGTSYLFIEESDGSRYASPVNVLPSQYMRRHLASLLRVSNWDWRLAGREGSLISTLVKMRQAMAFWHNEP